MRSSRVLRVAGPVRRIPDCGALPCEPLWPRCQDGEQRQTHPAQHDKSHDGPAHM